MNPQRLVALASDLFACRRRVKSASIGVTSAQAHGDFSELQAELPLAFRLRRSWSEADLLELRKTSDDCADSWDKDDASTFDGNDERSLADFGSDGSTTGDYVETIQSWYEESTSFPDVSPVNKQAGPPGNFAKPFGQLGGQCVNLPSQLHGPPGNWVSHAKAFDQADLFEQDPSSCDAVAEPSEPTTLLVSNLPRTYNRSLLMELLSAEGLLTDCDLVYLPVEFKVGIGYGYAFVNFVSHEAACAAMEALDGLADLREANLAEGALQACWSSKQGLHMHIELYRNSPVMHKSVDDEAKPALLRGGVRLPFPEPTRRLRAPRARRALLPQPGLEADAMQVAWREPLAA
jgi:hypothetical protein